LVRRKEFAKEIKKGKSESEGGNQNFARGKDDLIVDF
jgi:hypothetical protein